MTVQQTRRVRCRHASAADQPALATMLTDPATLGALPDAAGASGTAAAPPAVWQQTAAIRVIESVATGRVIGACRLYDVDPRAGSGWFDVHGVAEHQGGGRIAEGCLCHLEWAFAQWDLRWLYAHVLEPNWPAFASIVRHLAPEVHLGILRERVIHAGAPCDVHVLGISRGVWLASPARRRLMRRLDDPGPA